MSPNSFGLGPAELVVILIVLAILVVPGVFYILSLKRALEKCSPASRTMDPGMAWLLLIPLFNLVWQFIVVGHMARSLGNEFRSRGIPAEPEPGKSLGMAMCILGACGMIPILGVLASLAGFVCWILYWVRIAEYTRRLDTVPAVGYSGGGSSTKYLVIALGCIAGFLLLVFVPLVVMVALPRFNGARTAAQEVGAVHAMTAIHMAETQYYSEHGRYATSLEQLGASGIIDSALATGEKGGFRFELRAAPAGYVVHAEPVASGGSGSHTYYSDQSMVIRRHDAPEPAEATDAPLDAQ